MIGWSSSSTWALSLVLLALGCGGQSAGDSSAGAANIDSGSGGAGQVPTDTSIAGARSEPVVVDECLSYSDGQPQASVVVPVKLALPLSSAPTEADSLLFEACRNDTCASGRLLNGQWQEPAWMFELQLFGGTEPILKATWNVSGALNGDRYRLSYKTAAAAPEVSIFDVQATYTSQLQFTCVSALMARIVLTDVVTLVPDSAGEGGAAGAAGAAADAGASGQAGAH